MDTLSTKILKQIKTENIKPTPKWQFLLRESVTWVTFSFSLIVGGTGFAIILFLFNSNSDIFVNLEGHLNVLQSILVSIPIFWFILTAFFVFLAYYNFKHTPDGFKFNVAKVLLLSLLGSVIIGTVIHFTGFASVMNSWLAQIPYYTQIADPRYVVWMQPQDGKLAGEIIEIDLSSNTLKLKDLNNKEWTINIENTYLKPSVELGVGNKIKIVGKQASDNTFTATEVRPWNGKNAEAVKGIFSNKK